MIVELPNDLKSSPGNYSRFTQSGDIVTMSNQPQSARSWPSASVTVITAIATWVECPDRDFDRQGKMNASLPGSFFGDVNNAGN